MNSLTFFVVLIFCLGVLINNYTEACSCMGVHPQDHYCQSDFVILARIRKEIRTGHYKIYKAKIRKEFKMSEKARLALKSGRIQTPLQGSMCGLDLEQGKLYLLAGRVMGLQAHVSLCGFSMPWKEVTPRQRKGFRLLYGKGCSCKISYLMHMPIQKDRCAWNNFNCQSKYGICLRSPTGQCHWSKSLDLKKCMKGDYKPEIRTTQKPIEDILEPIREKVPEPLMEKYPEPVRERAIPLREKKPDYYRELNAANRRKYHHYRDRRNVVEGS